MISQSRYVDVKSNILAVNGGLPQMAALVITSAEMVTGAANKTEYDSGKPVYLTKNDITLQFAEDDRIRKRGAADHDRRDPGFRHRCGRLRICHRSVSRHRYLCMLHDIRKDIEMRRPAMHL